MDDYKELIERLRYEGYDVSRNEAANAIESLLAENERLKHNLSTTEQTMHEYQELAAKRLEEIAKYRDVPVVAWEITFQSPDTPNTVADYLQIDSSATVEQLIVKPGEEK